VAAGRCHAQHGIPIVVAIDGYSLVANAASDILGREAIGHAGGDEASVVLATRPDLVDRSRLGLPQMNQALQRTQALVRAARGVLPIAMDRLTPSGATGDSSGADGEAGSEILGRAAGQLRAIAEEVMDLDIDAFRPS
jgi:creatinine amidohydrolase/Fe(II)-dependent formamide hydrolase-like protein